jgi:hypothetical protein
VWVALLIVGAAAGVALGQQCARTPLPPVPALVRLLTASVLAAGVMALLGYAGGGQLGNFGAVGVDQATFGPAAFLWFFVVGGVTIVMANGLVRRPRRVKPAPAPEPIGEPDDEVLAEAQTAPLILPAPDPAGEDEAPPPPPAEPEPEPLPEPDPEPVPPRPPVDHQALADLPDAEDLLEADNDGSADGASGDGKR